MPNLDGDDNAISRAIRNATGQSDVDPNFQSDVINALLQEGLDLTRITAQQQNQLVQRLWNNPDLQDFWTTYFDGGVDGVPSMTTEIRNMLFVPAKSTDLDLLSTGINLRVAQGQRVSSSELAALGAGNQMVPMPFDPQYMSISGYGYDDPDPDFASGVHEGIDYGLPSGTTLYSMGAGTVTYAGWNGGYGNFVEVTLSNGMKVRYGHLSNIGVTMGESVNPGEVLGESGSTGNSSGPHLHFEIRNPDGSTVDPATILNQVASGVTFTALNWPAGRGVDKTDAKNRMLGIDPILNAKYAPLVSLWKKYFGSEPTAAQTLQMAAHGTDVNAIDDFIRSMQSHIPGMNVGQYFDLRALVDKTMTDELGHAGTDGIVKELFDRGNSAPGEVKHFINSLSENALNAMGHQTYNTIRAANAGPMHAYYGETGFDPRVAVAQFQQSGGQQATNTESAQAVTPEPITHREDREWFGNE